MVLVSLKTIKRMKRLLAARQQLFPFAAISARPVVVCHLLSVALV
jgi:hypothetical protein